MSDSQELTVQIGGRDVGLSAILAKIDAEMAQNANSAARLGQAYGRLAVAQGQPKLASQVLAGTLQQASGASEKALLSLETQAARTNTGLAVLPRTLAGLSHEAASMASGMLGLGTAIGIAKAGFDSFADAFVFKAKLDATTASVKSQLEGFRDAGKTYAEANAFGRQFNITQEETNSILQSSVGSLRTSTASVTQLESALIRLQSKDVSKPISEAARALAELESGDVTSIKELFRVSAKDALAMRDAIVAGGDSVQVLNAYLDRTQTGMAALELRTRGAAGAMAEQKVAMEDLALAQAKFAQGPGLTIIGEQIRTTSGLTRVLSGDWQSMAASAHESIGAVGQAMQQSIASGGALGLIYRLLTGEAQAAAGATVQHATATLRSADADDRNAASSRGLSSALDAELTKKLDASQAAFALAQRQAQLDADSRLAAQGLLGAGDQATIMANKYGIAASQAQFLIAQQVRLGLAAGLAEQRAGERNPGTSGAAEAIDQENRRLQQLYRTLASPPKVARGGGGGGVRLSDQAKLNNSLLANQESYENKSEDAEQAHQQRLLQIDADFATQMRKAEDDLGQTQLDSRAGFYKSLGSIEDAGLRQALSAQYEAAFQEADAIARQRGADVGQKFLEAKQAALEAQAGRASEIAQATKAGDKDKAEYLAGVDKLYRAAEERKIKAAQEGQDSIAAQRDKQIAEEASKYGASQDKIGEAADRAADRQITAAERAGKAIDANTARAGRLSSAFDRVAPAAGTGQPTAATPTTAAATSAPSDDPIVSALHAAQDAIVAALGSVKNAADGTTSAVRASSGKFAS